MPLAGGFPCPTGQALVYRLVYAAEKKQRIQEALALLEAAEGKEEEGEGEKGKGAGWTSAVVALLVPESGEQQPRLEGSGVGYDVV